MQPEQVDVAIVGGGPAGLSAALMLGRCLRRVVVIDAGDHRNRKAHAIHGYLTRDGTSPTDLLRAAETELTRYPTVTLQSGIVTGVDGARGAEQNKCEKAEHERRSGIGDWHLWRTSAGCD